MYKKLDFDFTEDICIKLHTFLNKLFREGLINKDMMDFFAALLSKLGLLESTSVDIWLQPIMKKLLSFIQDASHFIKMIEETPLPQNVLLASIDVTSLYTIIVHCDGIEVAIEALQCFA